MTGPSCSYDVESNSSVTFNDHNYYSVHENTSKFSKPDYSDKYLFLTEDKKGILGKAGLLEKDLTPDQAIMYKFHRNVTSRLSKLKTDFLYMYLNTTVPDLTVPTWIYLYLILTMETRMRLVTMCYGYCCFFLCLYIRKIYDFVK